MCGHVYLPPCFFLLYRKRLLLPLLAFSSDNIHLASAPRRVVILHSYIKKQSCSRACYNKCVNGAVNRSEPCTYGPNSFYSQCCICIKRADRVQQHFWLLAVYICRFACVCVVSDTSDSCCSDIFWLVNCGDKVMPVALDNTLRLIAYFGKPACPEVQLCSYSVSWQSAIKPIFIFMWWWHTKSYNKSWWFIVAEL